MTLTKNIKPNNFKKYAPGGMRQKIQKIGSFMAGMILPSIGVFIAWGLWTSMFLYNSGSSHGWFTGQDKPDTLNSLGAIVGPGIKWLIPILIGVNAGKMIYGVRGAAFGAFMTVVIIVGTDEIWNIFPEIIAIDGKSLAGRAPNQIVGAMIVAPFSVWAFKKIESLYINKVKVGFEMLIRNFSLAIIAILMGLVLFFAWAWIMFGITWILTKIIGAFGNNKYVAPLMTIFTEPTRTIFLNNALNHGILSPIGLEEIRTLQEEGIEAARSIFFLFGGNAGPGFGLLIAYAIFKKGTERTNALGSSLIQLVGGIHEVYYVYVIAKPKMIISTILGAATSMAVFSFLGGGTSTIVSPGSIISVIGTSPDGYALGINLLGIFSGAFVTFIVAGFLLWLERKNDSQQASTNTRVVFTDEGMSFENGSNDQLATENSKIESQKAINYTAARKIVVACDAGLGSSTMAAGIIKKWVKENNIDIEVTNAALKDLPADADIVVTTNVFENFAKEKTQKDNIYTVKQFLNKSEYNELYENLKKYKTKKTEEK
ncbi:PTS transporter subunit EIIC [Mycoplasma iguanae]|uniref:PTS system mannitol-specific EIICB component n=1 Tax=Mycoplasma iguanae TaxID=292461 RepID=A0ABY5R8N7_9MOLU|nr:PTS transporter subunit EIIC [Mycoplasma iguanae]UVD81646.1 PTS transporter subunit EIIC [Mycoplasma iguanae]